MLYSLVLLILALYSMSLSHLAKSRVPAKVQSLYTWRF
ncbi:hypothetical protein ECH7EC4501_3903 [Escherichia coli O157:H7 str. EC4501]|nr:hypothetical protein ECH7EC4501_3903 [Escherichia coli O157:H7 str. EC4501]